MKTFSQVLKWQMKNIHHYLKTYFHFEINHYTTRYLTTQKNLPKVRFLKDPLNMYRCDGNETKKWNACPALYNLSTTYF